MGISALRTDYNLDPPDDYEEDYHYEELENEIAYLETQLKEVQEENAWLKFNLEKYGLLSSVINEDRIYNEQEAAEQGAAE